MPSYGLRQAQLESEPMGMAVAVMAKTISRKSKDIIYGIPYQILFNTDIVDSIISGGYKFQTDTIRTSI